MTAEARALNALWRNHPLTAVEDRWGERAHRMARANRDMLLSWAATQPDYRLRDCRTIGTATLAWIRANEPTAAAPDPAPLDVERLARAVKAVVLFSGGVGSWAAARRAVERWDTTLLFTDTMTEDEDTYRWLAEAAADVGAPLVRIADGRDIWQVFRDTRYLGNTRADPCSRILKREQSRKWLTENRDPADTVVVLGFDWTEVDRLDRARKAWEPWRIAAPMVEPPYRMRSELLAEAESRGIVTQRLYRMGMPHANCGGGCVKAGQGHFATLLAAWPSRYAEWEANEEAIRQHLGKDVSILRDRAGGTTDVLTLRALRERIEARQPIEMLDFGGCACMEEPA